MEPMEVKKSERGQPEVRDRVTLFHLGATQSKFSFIQAVRVFLVTDWWARTIQGPTKGQLIKRTSAEDIHGGFT